MITRIFSSLTVGQLAAAVFGVALIARCEVGPPPPGGWIVCWLGGGLVAGVPGLAQAAQQIGYLRGYNTYNPDIKEPQPIDRPQS
jgi:hypothetical protein